VPADAPGLLQCGWDLRVRQAAVRQSVCLLPSRLPHSTAGGPWQHLSPGRWAKDKAFLTADVPCKLMVHSGGEMFNCSANSYLNPSRPPEERTTLDACISCGPNSATKGSGNDSVAACDCNPGFYRDSLSSFACMPCPVPGSDCHEGGATLATLRLEPGYWRANLGTIDMRQCPDAAKGILSGCTGIAEVPCTAGLTGVYCLFCTNSSGIQQPALAAINVMMLR